jgi:putative ABC transport system permease protein
MLKTKFLPVILKQILRRPVRSGLTLGGVALAMFLFYAVQAMHHGVKSATERTATDTTLVVYRENRYCPFTSQLPEDYGARIAKLDGVESVVPMKIVVNNCRTSLDVITFRGVPTEDFERGVMRDMKVVAGSVADWKKRSDAALVGDRLAQRRGLKVGDQIDLGGIRVMVAGIVSSPHPQDQNVAYTHLEFIQRSAGNRVGIVTQFNVKVRNPQEIDAVAAAIDEMFRHSPEPTSTSSEKAFTARAAKDLVELVSFARLLGWGALVAVFALVANAILLSVQERVKEHAVLQTLGFSHGLIARLIIVEGAVLSLLGGVLGLTIAIAVLYWGTFSFSVEGLSVNVDTGWGTVLVGLLLCAVVGIVAGLFPAWQASRREIASCFRSV